MGEKEKKMLFRIIPSSYTIDQIVDEYASQMTLRSFDNEALLFLFHLRLIK